MQSESSSGGEPRSVEECVRELQREALKVRRAHAANGCPDCRGALGGRAMRRRGRLREPEVVLTAEEGRALVRLLELLGARLGGDWRGVPPGTGALAKAVSKIVNVSGWKPKSGVRRDRR